MKALDGINNLQTTATKLCEIKQRVQVLTSGDDDLGKILKSVVGDLVKAISGLGSMRKFIQDKIGHATKIPPYKADTRIFTGEFHPKATKSTELFDLAGQLSELGVKVEMLQKDPVNHVIVTNTNERIKPTKTFFENQKKAFNAIASAHDSVVGEIKKANEADMEASKKIAKDKEAAEIKAGEDQKKAADKKAADKKAADKKAADKKAADKKAADKKAADKKAADKKAADKKAADKKAADKKAADKKAADKKK